MGMRTAAFTLGLIGGIFGILAAIIEMAGGGVVNAVDDDASLIVLGFVSLLLAIVGIVGATLAKTRPGWSGTLQLVAMVGGLLTAGWFWVVSACLFLTGAVCAYVEYSRAGRFLLLERRVGLDRCEQGLKTSHGGSHGSADEGE